MSVLNIRTQDQLIFIEKPVPILTSGNKNNDVLKVTFDETWDCENGKFYASFYIDDPKDADIISLTRNEDNSFTCLIPNGVLRKEGVFKLGVWCEFGDKTKTSNNKEIRVHQGAVTSNEVEENEIDIAVNSAKEEYRNELETSLETATGENYDNKTWEELNNTVSALPIISEEQTQALGDYDLFKYYLAGIDGDGGNWSHQLFRMPPKDENGNELNYKLPYIYTPNMKWHKDNKAFCNQLLEVGIDVSKAKGVGNSSGNAPFATQKLQRLIMTGNANALTLTWFMNSAYALEYIKLETPNVSVLEADSQYYNGAFYRCEKLRTIDCELDFTGQTDTTKMFYGCYMLKDLRIKPFTLSTSLDLGDCRSLHHNDLNDYESLISILNGITDDTELAKNMTITFSNEITDFTTGEIHYWNCYVYHCDNGIFYTDPSEVPEGYAYLELPLYEAFIAKGVTIAWR